MDEAWVTAGHSLDSVGGHNCELTMSSRVVSRQVSDSRRGKGQLLIVTRIGREAGFVVGCLEGNTRPDKESGSRTHRAPSDWAAQWTRLPSSDVTLS